MTAIELREVVAEDLPTLYEHQADPVAHRMAGFTPRDREAFMAHWREKVLGDPRNISRAILVEGEVVGHVCCFDRGGKREVGYWIAREHWGRGIATQALSRFLGDVTERPLHAGVARGNEGSLRVLAKCGFVVASEDEEGIHLVLEETSG